jgi:hypothetical protein
MKRPTKFLYQSINVLPRRFWLSEKRHKYQFDCPLLDENQKTWPEHEDYSPFYTVSVWGVDSRFHEIGAVPVDAVDFDVDKFLVDASILDIIGE